MNDEEVDYLELREKIQDYQRIRRYDSVSEPGEASRLALALSHIYREACEVNTIIARITESKSTEDEFEEGIADLLVSFREIVSHIADTKTFGVIFEDLP